MNAKTLVLLLIVPITIASAQGEEAPDLSDAACLECHSDPELAKEGPDGKLISLFVDQEKFAKSVHGSNECISCHDEITELPHSDSLKRVDCFNCHSEEGEIYIRSTHGKAFEAKIPEAPSCTTCHGNHAILPKSDSASRTHPLNQVEICTTCHLNPQIAQKYHLPARDKIEAYRTGIHGRGLFKSGLLVSATCVNCHSAHNVRPKTDPKSTVYWSKIPQLCGTCHLGILEDFETSTHGQLWKRKSALGPGCVTCHGSHGIDDPVTLSFQLHIPNLCEKCHSQKAPTYKDNFHGQVVELGFSQSATCADCHTAHKNLPANDPRSTVHPFNLQKTCGACHGEVSKAYITYDPHLDPTDPNQNRIVYYIWRFFIITIYFVFIFFGLHYLLWFQRSLVGMLRGEFKKQEAKQDQIYIRRFSPAHVWVHVAMTVSFTTLAVTGFTIYFHETSWAKSVAKLFGGIEFMRYLHRVSAIITFGYAFFHIAYVGYKGLIKRERILKGPGSMIPNLRDLADFFRNMRYFLYLGRVPKFDRWTYWEKLEYLVEFWGVPVIGISGLALWYPKFFTDFLPGWTLNAAQVVHTYEAFLAAGYVFLFHYFVAHLRAETFPMDPVIFTGRLTLERFKEERPLEYQRLVDQNELERYFVGPPSKDQNRLSNVLGFSALVTGLVLTIAVLGSILF